MYLCACPNRRYEPTLCMGWGFDRLKPNTVMLGTPQQVLNEELSTSECFRRLVRKESFLTKSHLRYPLQNYDKANFGMPRSRSTKLALLLATWFVAPPRLDLTLCLGGLDEVAGEWPTWIGSVPGSTRLGTSWWWDYITGASGVGFCRDTGCVSDHRLRHGCRWFGCNGCFSYWTRLVT